METFYVNKNFTWDRKSVQMNVLVQKPLNAFCTAHPKLKLFSGLRKTGTAPMSDHKCAMAGDFVPLTQDAQGLKDLQAAAADARAKKFPYVELVWTDTNKHLHVSFRRCPTS